ncbi:MAG: hypothetical protein WCF44_14625 [Candidatus Methylophosphatis roskildensis]
MTARKPEIRKQLREFLQPLLQEGQQRSALVKTALGGTSIFTSIDFRGTPYQLAVELPDLPAGCDAEAIPGMLPPTALLDDRN